MLFWVASFAALGGFLYGYDLALIGGALGHIRAEFHLSEVMVEMVVGAAKIGAVFGTFLGGAMMLYYGRRKTIGIDSLFYMTGPIIMAASWDVTGLVIGRFVLGIGIGISAVVVPTYLGEVAPARLRGRMVELYEVMLCAGMLGALLADVALMHVPGNWRWMVGMPFFPSAITAYNMALGLFILPESPRWLVVNQRLDEALAVIHRIYTKTVLPEGCQNSTAEVEHELMDLWSSVEKTKAARDAQRESMKRSKTRSDPAQGALAQATTLLGKGGRGKRFHTLEQDHQTNSAAKHGPEGGSDVELALQPEAGAGAGYVQDLQANGHLPAELESVPTGGNDQEAATISLISMAEQRAPEGGDKSPARLQQNGSPSQAGLQLTPVETPASPASSSGSALDPGLYRSLSMVPRGLPPIRTKSEPSLTPMGMPEKGFGGRERWLKRRERNQKQPSPTASREEGFWSTQATMLQDIWLVMIGPERKAVWVAILLAFFNQGCASTAVINYAPTVLEGAGVRNYADATAWTAMITGAKTVGVFIAVGLVDSKGRRPLLIWGSAIIASSMALISLGDYSQNVPLVLFAMCAFILSFSASYAGIFWVLCSEMFSMSTKSPAVSAAAAMLFLAGAVSNLCFLSLHTALGAASFLIFGGIAAAGGIFVYFMVPETKGKTLAEVQALLGIQHSGEVITLQQAALPRVDIPIVQNAAKSSAQQQKASKSQDLQSQSLLAHNHIGSDNLHAHMRPSGELPSDWASYDRASRL